MTIFKKNDHACECTECEDRYQALVAIEKIIADCERVMLTPSVKQTKRMWDLARTALNLK